MVNAASPTVNFNRVQVRHTYIGWDGSAIGGTVTFTPRAARAVDLAALTTIIARPIVGTISPSGVMSVLLPATNDPDINVSFTYAVVENFAGGESYDISVPVASEAAGIDLANLTRSYPVTASIGLIPLAQKGVAGGVAALNGSGQVLDGSGAVVAGGGTTPNSTIAGYVTGAGATQTALDGRYRDAKVLRPEDFGAVGDGSTDDATAINNALAAAGIGGVVRLKAGRTYRVGSPINPPPGVTLEHPVMFRGSTTVANAVPTIKALGSFTGTGIITFLDKAVGGYAVEHENAVLRNINIDGSAIARPATISGIYAEGTIHYVTLENVNISYAPDRGIFTKAAVISARGDGIARNPYSWVMTNVQAHSSGLDNFRMGGMTDAVAYNLRSNAAGRHGFYLDQCANSTWTACRSEWSGQYGMYLTANWGSSNGSGGAIFSGFSTDRNTMDGVRVDATGTHALNFQGLNLRRDGAGSTSLGYCGMNVIGATMAVIVSGLSVTAGADDLGAGNVTPQIGFRAGGSGQVQVSSGFVWGIATSILDVGDNTSFTVAGGVVKQTGAIGATTTVNGVSTGFGGGSGADPGTNTQALLDLKVSRRPSLPAYFGKVSVLTTFASGHPFTTATGFGAATNLSQSTGTAQAGTQQASLVTDAAGGLGTLTGTGVTAANFSAANNYARIWLKTLNQQQIGDLRVRVSDTGGLAAGRYAEWTLCSATTVTASANQQEIVNGNVLTGFGLSPADAVLTGSPNMAAITEWRIFLADRNNGQGAQTVTLNRIDAVPSGVSGLGTKGVLSLTFDDSYAGQGTFARQVLAAYGAQATFFPIVDALGSSGTFMSATQLRQLHEDGHEVGIHSYAKTVHDNIATTSQTLAAADYRAAAQWAAEQGYGSPSFAYPNGYFYPSSDPVRRVYDCARTVMGQLKVNPLPVTDRYRVRSISGIGGTAGTAVTVLTGTGGVLEKASAANGLVVATLHDVTSGASAAFTQISRADLDTLVAKARALDMAIVPFGHVVPRSAALV